MRLNGLWVLVIAVVGLSAGAGTAPASDAGLRKVVKRQEARVSPLARAWGEADSDLANATDTNTAAAATKAFRDGLRRFKVAVTPIKTVSTNSKTGKKRLLSAIRQFDLGLVRYQTLLEQLAAGASKDDLKDTIASARRRLAAAAEDEQAALKLLGFKVKSNND